MVVYRRVYWPAASWDYIDLSCQLGISIWDGRELWAGNEELTCTRGWWPSSWVWRMWERNGDHDHLLGLNMSAIHAKGSLGGGELGRESSSTGNSTAKGDGSDTGSRERAGHAIAWAPQLLGWLFSLSASATMHANYSVIFCKPPTFCWR